MGIPILKVFWIKLGDRDPAGKFRKIPHYSVKYGIMRDLSEIMWYIYSGFLWDTGIPLFVSGIFLDLSGIMWDLLECLMFDAISCIENWHEKCNITLSD